MRKSGGRDSSLCDPRLPHRAPRRKPSSFPSLGLRWSSEGRTRRGRRGWTASRPRPGPSEVPSLTEPLGPASSSQPTTAARLLRGPAARCGAGGCVCECPSPPCPPRPGPHLAHGQSRFSALQAPRASSRDRGLNTAGRRLLSPRRRPGPSLVTHLLTQAKSHLSGCCFYLHC